MRLLYIQHQSLEVFPFGMRDVDRVVGRLRELMQDTYLAPGFGGGTEDCQPEHLLGDSLGAGECE